MYTHNHTQRYRIRFGMKSDDIRISFENQIDMFSNFDYYSYSKMSV